jgi:hypothetical protein
MYVVDVCRMVKGASGTSNSKMRSLNKTIYRGKLGTPKTQRSVRTPAFTPGMMSDVESWREFMPGHRARCLGVSFRENFYANAEGQLVEAKHGTEAQGYWPSVGHVPGHAQNACQPCQEGRH